MWTQEQVSQVTTDQVFAEKSRLHRILYCSCYLPCREPPEELRADYYLYGDEIQTHIQNIKIIVNSITPEYMVGQRRWLDL